MADREWLKNLANMDAAGKKPISATSPASQQALTASKIQTALQSLYMEAAEACEIFNSYAGKKKTIRILNLQAPDGMQNGIILLLGRAQLRLQRVEFRLEAALTTFHSHNTSSGLLHRFEPQADNFGNLTWLMDGKAYVTNEMLIQQLLQDIYQATFADPDPEKSKE